MRSGPSQNVGLRNKFIISESDFAKEQLESLIDRVKDYCVLDEGGGVHIRKRQLAQWRQVGLVMVARFIGSKLDPKFPPVLSAAELAEFLGVNKAVAIARTKELVDRGFAVRVSKGHYRINVPRIEDFLNQLRETTN